MEIKTSYARKLGVKGITTKAREKNKYLAEVETAMKHASDLEDEISRLLKFKRNKRSIFKFKVFLLRSKLWK